MCSEIYAIRTQLPKTMGYQLENEQAIRYRGFLLLPLGNQKWLVRPERSPMTLLPFRTNICSIEEVKAIIDERLSLTTSQMNQAA